MRIGEHLVTTVFDLLLAQYGVKRGETHGEWPRGYDDLLEPFTPAWQERLTGVPADVVIQVAREFARNAELTGGRSMIATGAGLSHWHNSDVTHRAMIVLLAACGCIGRNGGGLAHYVGQQKVLPLAGWATIADAADWVGTARKAPATSWFYMASDQWRYEDRSADEWRSPLARGSLSGMAPIDALAQAARLGWQLPHPAFDRNPLTLAADAAEALRSGGYLDDYVASQVKEGSLGFSATDPDSPANWPRILFVWRANLLGSSAQGREYILRHLVGSDSDGPMAEEAPPGRRPRDVSWREQAPIGKLDLLIDLDLRMTSTGAFADVLLPAAGWYEKSDLSSTDLHPFVNSLNPAIDPPWEARSDWDAFKALAGEFSRLAAVHLGVREDVVASALGKDTPAEASQPRGHVADWWKGDTKAVPGLNMPALSLVTRDFAAVGEMYGTLGPRIDNVGCGVRGLTWGVTPEVDSLCSANGVAQAGPGAGRPLLEQDHQVAEAMLALSGSTNGRLAHVGFEALEGRAGRDPGELSRGDPGGRIRWSDVQARPQTVHASPEWSGSGDDQRPYSAFSLNVRGSIPWRTLTGRIQTAIDHEWFKRAG